MPEWRPVWVYFSRRLADGGCAHGPLMRRRAPSGWEYRAMTEDEERAYVADGAW